MFSQTFAAFRYEGEWLQNNMEGHGVVEVEIPDIEPVPGSKYATNPYFSTGVVIIPRDLK